MAYKVWIVAGVCLTVSTAMSSAQQVTQAQEDEMRKALRDRIHNMKDDNGFRFLTAGIIRAGFHDCVMGCDGCLDSRRLFQGSNNGLEPTWKTLKALYDRKFFNYCSRADFFALAVTEAVDYTAQRAEQEGICTRSEQNRTEPNDCRPNMQMVWGRRTCAHPQRVEIRNIPDADQDPYIWFEQNMQFTPREAVCIMGSHAVGKLRRNETGFQGDYTGRPDVLDNEYYKMMVKPNMVWTQVRHDFDFEGFNETRHQWELPTDNITRVNSDMMMIYNITDIGAKGRVRCVLPPTRRTRRLPRCPLSKNANLVVEMANDNKAFLKCFGEVMDKMLHNGYREGELVSTGQVIPEPPVNPITFTLPPTTSTTARPPVQSGSGNTNTNQQQQGNTNTNQQQPGNTNAARRRQRQAARRLRRQQRQQRQRNGRVRPTGRRQTPQPRQRGQSRGLVANLIAGSTSLL